ncbi:MAG: hypothetical protein K2M34_02925 [Alphaproteobacteria bacterium]|nr:hypothetical protein [Alphaproteobacteria bacterium]
MESQKPNFTQIMQQLLSDPRVVNVMSTVLAEMLQNAAKSAEKATEQTIEQSAPQPELANIPQENVAPVSEPIAQPVQESDIRQSQEYIDYSTKTDAQLRALYAYRIKRNIEFSPAFQAILTDRFKTYNPEQKKFTGRGGKRRMAAKPVTPNIQPAATIAQPGKPERIINWDEKSDAILWKAYEHRKKTGIDDKLNAALAKRFPGEYDPVARKRIKKVKLHDFATKHAKESATAATMAQRRAVAPVKKEAPVEKPTELSVKLQLVRQTLDAAYYNVYVNGRKILINHANTELKLFADGTILGIHGIVTNDRNLPQRPLWLIYDTNLVQRQFPGRSKITKYNTYATNVAATPTGVSITLNTADNLVQILETERLKRQAGLTRFEIER